LGAIAQIFLPFLIARRDDPNLKWEWKHIYPKLISVAIFVLVLPVLVDDLAGISDLALQQAFLYGYGAASFGRLAVNGGGAVVEAVRNGR
jgi:hypothetical protein